METAGVAMATPEKALLDYLYLRPARSNLFRTLPELELPLRFNSKSARRMIQRILSVRRRTLVARAFDKLTAGAAASSRQQQKPRI